LLLRGIDGTAGENYETPKDAFYRMGIGSFAEEVFYDGIGLNELQMDSTLYILWVNNE
jgi:hypothetical protein